MCLKLFVTFSTGRTAGTRILGRYSCIYFFRHRLWEQSSQTMMWEMSWASQCETCLQLTLTSTASWVLHVLENFCCILLCCPFRQLRYWSCHFCDRWWELTAGDSRGHGRLPIFAAVRSFVCLFVCSVFCTRISHPLEIEQSKKIHEFELIAEFLTFRGPAAGHNTDPSILSLTTAEGFECVCDRFRDNQLSQLL